MVLRCLETAPDPSLPVCPEFCLPRGVEAEVLAASVQDNGETPPNDLDLDNVLQESLTAFCGHEVDSIAVRGASCVTQPLISVAAALQPPSSIGSSSPRLPLKPHAVPVQSVSGKDRVRGGKKWRQPSSVSTTL